MTTMTRSLRDLLIDHIDGPVSAVMLGRQTGTAQVAIRLGYIKAQGGYYWDGKLSRGRRTFLTRKGREALGAALAEWADALVRFNNARV